jgi:hypothetical protein
MYTLLQWYEALNGLPDAATAKATPLLGPTPTPASHAISPLLLPHTPKSSSHSSSIATATSTSTGTSTSTSTSSLEIMDELPPLAATPPPSTPPPDPTSPITSTMGTDLWSLLCQRYGRSDTSLLADRISAYKDAISMAMLPTSGFDLSRPVAIVASPGRDRLFMGHTDMIGLVH